MKIPNRYLFKGQWLTVRQIVDKTGLGESTIRTRIQYNIPLDAPYGRIKRFLYCGQMLTAKQIAARIGLHQNRVLGRIQEGKPLTHARYAQT